MTAHSAPAAPQPARSICPHLGLESNPHSGEQALDYPSFENRCWAGEQPVPLLLTDQATLCLCVGFRQCPRYIAARATRRQPHLPDDVPMQESGPPLGNSDPISHALRELESEIKVSTAARSRSRQRWGWIGAGLIFMSSLLCGGVFAGYIGWQLVNRDLLVTEPGSVDTLAQGQPTPQPQLYLVVTATSESPVAPVQVAPAQPQAFPPAVTPTAIVIAPQETPQSPVNLIPMPGTGIAQAAPPPNVQLEIPTRRPTPVLDIPTSTPSPPEVATAPPTATPVPILGPPIVLFSAQDAALAKGDCTLVTWHVENVRAVFYENLGVDGQGQREECMDDHLEDYVLSVVLADGSTRNYTTTVAYIPPTRTPSPDPTATIYVEPTPTWTPWVPTATATPQVRYGVQLDINGSAELTCSRGTDCTADLLVTNTGDGLDNITLFFTEAGAWSRQLCRLDGACSEDHLTIANIGPGNSALVALRVSIPAEAEPTSMTYRLLAQSQTASDAKSVQLTIHIQYE